MNNSTRKQLSGVHAPVFGTVDNAYARRTTTDDIFDKIHGEIVSMRLEPGSKLSEVEIARQFDVSRQPVREAFIRLSNMKLLQVRPQRATIVRKISKSDIRDARFVRISIEVEVARLACAKFNSDMQVKFENNLEEQAAAVKANDYDTFHALDGQFHRLFCEAADHESAYRTIEKSKKMVDRLCTLSLSQRTEFEGVYQDHVNLFEFLKQGDETNLIKLLRQHVSRIDATIAEVSAQNAEYFED